MIKNILFALILFYFCLEPILNHFEFKSLKSEPDRKIRYYWMTILGLWLPITFVLILPILGGLTYSDLGINPIRLDAGPLNKWLAYSILLISILYMITLIYHIMSMKISARYRVAYYAKINQAKTKEEYIEYLLPDSPIEMHLWKIISVSAGVCEEILFRGFLMHALFEFFPELSIYLIILITSLVFGIWHSYQGIKGVFITFLVGVFLSLLYLSVGSILPAILLHIVMDLSAQDAKSTEKNIQLS